MRAIVLSASLALAGVGAVSLISVEEEIAIGRAAQRDVRRKVQEIGDRQVAAYVSRLGARLAAHADGPRYPYSFTVGRAREVNAFALPGGPVWIHHGVLLAAANESQLAGVLAHEIAHIARRHAADRMTKQLIANGLIGLFGAVLGSEGGGRTARLGAQALAGGYLLTFSREDEREADAAGLRLMQRAGWDGRGMLEFLETLRRARGSDPGSVALFLSSHPAPAERAGRLRRALGDRRSGRRDSAQFRAVKRRMQQQQP